MLAVIEHLLALQDRDRRLLRLQGELEHANPERRTQSARLAKATSDLEAAKLRVKTLESERKRLELEAEAKKLQIDRYASQQLQTRKNEEYKALANEIDTCKQLINALEDQQLELMEQIEAAQRQVAAATQTANTVKKMVETTLNDLDDNEKKMRAELATVEAERTTLAAQVDEGARVKYERLLRNKGANVVVGIEHSVCGGCHVKVPTQLVVHCQGEQELVVCSNCGRLLYYTPDMDLAVVD